MQMPRENPPILADLWDSPPAVHAVEATPCPLHMASTPDWDWHSGVIVSMSSAIAYHLWVYRSLYLHVARRMFRAIRQRRMGFGMRLSLIIDSGDGDDTVTIELLAAATQPQQQGIERANTDVVVTVEEDDHFHDCS